MVNRVLVALLCLIVCSLPAAGSPVAIRVMTFNLEDVRTEDLLNPDHPRLRMIAEIIQRIRPNILLLNEIAYDEPGGPGVPADSDPGQNGKRFVDNFLARPQAAGLESIGFNVFTAPSNTGRPSGFDLDRNGRVVSTYPPPSPGDADGSPGPQTAEGRAFGGDSWGFGTFPGQYAMAMLVDPRLELLSDDARTFRLLPWRYLPNHLMPQAPPAENEGEETDAEVISASDDKPQAEPDENSTDNLNTEQGPLPDTGWYQGEAGEIFRLSSKSFWDVPVRLPGGEVIHLLCSHPTPPAFDGPEQRNKRRNHDEIRLIADFIDGAAYLVDDNNRAGGLSAADLFVVLGDLNADPDEGSSVHNPIKRLLLDSPRVLDYPAPVSSLAIEGLDADDTAMFRLRVDYVLPSSQMRVLRSGLWRGIEGDTRPSPSDHFPVWADVVLPDREPSEP